MARHDGRRVGELRPVEIIRGFTSLAHGSALIRCGHTHVLCTASWVSGIPKWKAPESGGWLTAEYDMLPGSTGQRRQRNRYRVDGRTVEIQRLIGRVLRAVVDFEALGENTLLLDCDVLQADGGTRVTAITGAYVALNDAVRYGLRERLIRESPVREAVAAVSVGRLGNRTLLDLDYKEDKQADVDLNVAMTGSGRFVEVQGTAEQAPFTRAELDKMLQLASRGIRKLQAAQAGALRKRR